MKSYTRFSIIFHYDLCIYVIYVIKKDYSKLNTNKIKNRMQ
jgi:hypothetical protein